MLLFITYLAWRLVIWIPQPILLLLHLVTMLKLPELLWVLHFELITDLVQSYNVQRLLPIGSRHQNVGKLVLIMKLCPHVMHNCMSSFAVETWLESFDQRHHLLSEESVC